MGKPFVGVLLAFFCSPFLAAQPAAFKKTNQTIKEVTANMSTPVATSAFQKPMAFKEALMILHDQLKAKKKPVAFTVDERSFADEKPLAGSIFESPIKLKTDAKELPAENLLALMIEQITAHDAAFEIHPGHVAITTKTRAKKTKVM